MGKGGCWKESGRFPHATDNQEVTLKHAVLISRDFKHTGINLTKDAQGLYAYDKPLRTETGLIKWRPLVFITVNPANLPNASSHSEQSKPSTSTSFSKMYMETKDARITRTILDNNASGQVKLPGTKITQQVALS